MKAAGKHKYDTYRKTRLDLFIRSYAGYFTCNYIKTKYKIDDNLSASQLQEQFSGKRIIPEISRLSRVLNLNYQLLWRFVVLNGRQGLNRKAKTNRKIEVFLAIEEEMIFLTIARQDKEYIISDDYERATLSPAIERAAGNSLRHVNNDLIFEQQLNEVQKEYARWYYETACKYKIPTLRIIPFLLRLITL